MGYIPKNVAVYVQALAGAGAGMRAFGNFLTDATAADYLFNSQAADAYAQQVDTQWFALVGASITNFEMMMLMTASAGVWDRRSPLISTLGTDPNNYVAIARGVIAVVIEANAQVVNEGVNPDSFIFNGVGAGGITQLTGGVTAGPGAGSQVATLQLGSGATVQGVLPTGNQASQTMGGDVSGTTAAAVVIKINGTTVPAGGALTPGNVLTVTGAAAAAWQAAASGLAAPVTGTQVTKTTNYTIDSGGSDYIIFADTSGGAFPLTLPAPTAGRVLVVIDVKGTFETNNLTLQQHGAETINGVAASRVFRSNWGVWVITSDGTNWDTAGAGRRTKVIFNANGNFTVPSGITEVEVYGAGGAGGGGGGSFNTTSTNNSNGGGAGGASIASTIEAPVTPNAVIAVAVGSGGNGGAGGTVNGGNGTNGQDGNNSTFGSLATFQGASGGQGGQGVTVSTVPSGGACIGSGSSANTFTYPAVMQSGVGGSVGTLVPASGGQGGTSSVGSNGQPNTSGAGAFTAGSAGTATTHNGSGGGGGQGPRGSGGNGGNGVSQAGAGNAGTGAAANTGAGGGGGAGNSNAGATAGGVGGNGGSGFVWVMYND